jgi:hypothetical protein
MHTDGLKNEVRASTQRTLVDLYNTWPKPLAPATSNDARNAGIPSLQATDMVNSGDGEFRSMQGPAGIRNDSRSVQTSTWEKHGGAGVLPTEKYAPSGRR